MRNPSSSSSGIPCNCKRGAAMRWCRAVQCLLACLLAESPAVFESMRQVGRVRSADVRASWCGREGRAEQGAREKAGCRPGEDGGESVRRCFGQDRKSSKMKVKAGSTTSSSYVLADRKGLDDFPAPRPLTEPLWSFELRFEGKYGLAGVSLEIWEQKKVIRPARPQGPVAPPA